VTLVLSPEQALLVRAAAPSATASSHSSPVEWDEVMRTAEWHRLSGLLRRYLKRQDTLAVPGRVMDALSEATRNTMVLNMQRQVELSAVLAALAAADIPAMLLKGAALIESTYPELGLRPMADLDILVPRPAIHRAQSLIQAMGYDVVGGKVQADAVQRVLDHHHLFPLVKGAFVIELHHHVLFQAPPGFDISGYWDRAVAGTGPVAHLLPCPEDMFLHLGVHFAGDRIYRLGPAMGQLADLAWIASQNDMNWGALATRAAEYGVGDRLFLALHAATTLLGNIAPTDIVTGLRPASFRPDLGDHFIRQRVLPAQPSLPIERLSAHPRQLLFPTRAMLDAYVRPEETLAPSLMRLRARRAASLLRRLRAAAPRRRDLLADIRLSRWILSLRS
jgi:hypothetical protein